VITSNELKPAAELAAAASKPYPDDSAEYRAARARLLTEEIELRRHTERVAQMRRELPVGGEPAPYRFKDENGKTVALADMFGAHDTLVTYFWMYGPQRERPCPMCTSFLGSIDIPARDITQRVALAYRALAPDGSEWPALDVWVKRDGVVRHFWGAEMGGTADPGQDARGAPEIAPLWLMLDLTPQGRGKDWYPQLQYPAVIQP
jgi:predicted dithiol-disulfide oxidoreductase (DUF899 family)